jgi:hypothetical protein
MSYQYIESKYPEEYPNVDVNFDNDILYAAILENKIEKPNTPDMVQVNVVPASSAASAAKKSLRDQKKNQSDIWMSITFIIAIIVIILIWYIYGGKSEKQIEPIDKYADVAELIMLSPDLGMGVRYGA